MKKYIENIKMNISESCMLLVFLGILFGGMMWCILSPDESFSENENRILQKKPQFSVESIASGKFMEEFEKYAADTVPKRSAWVSLKNTVDRSFGKSDNGSAYWAKDGYTFPIESIDSRQFEKNLTYVATFRDKLKKGNKLIDFDVMLIPTGTEILKDKLNEGSPCPNQKELLAKVKEKFGDDAIDVLPEMTMHKYEYIYYKTDHHWTTLGAFYGFKAWCEENGREHPQLKDYRRTIVNTEFFGTTYSKNMTFFSKPDTIEKLFDNYMESAKAEIFDTMKAVDNNLPKHAGLFDERFLGKKDKYSYFLGGNNPLVYIKSRSKIGEKCLIVKDSYGNAFVPFLTKEFDECYVVDLRYYKGNVRELAEEKNINHVVVLYNAPQFTNDRNVVFLTK